MFQKGINNQKYDLLDRPGKKKRKIKSKEQYLSDAQKAMEDGSVWTKTTVFRWKPDWNKASACYEKVCCPTAFFLILLRTHS